MMSHRIIVEDKFEDLTVLIRRHGSRIVVKCERPGIASSVERAIVKAIAPDSEPRRIGFTADGEE